jgi:hypothetical protein
MTPVDALSLHAGGIETEELDESPGEGLVQQLGERLGYVPNCITDAGLNWEDVADLAYHKVAHAIDMSRGGTRSDSYEKVVVTINVGRDLAGRELPFDDAKAAGVEEVWASAERRPSNWSAFVDGLSRTFGIFGIPRRLPESGFRPLPDDDDDDFASTFGKIERAIDIAEKRGR